MPKRIQVDKDGLVDLCSRRYIARLSFFGSVLQDGFRADSNIDVLVVFKEEHTPGFLRIAQIERELSVLLDNRKIDLRTFRDLSPYFRKRGPRRRRSAVCSGLKICSS